MGLGTDGQMLGILNGIEASFCTAVPITESNPGSATLLQAPIKTFGTGYKNDTRPIDVPTRPT
jgi:hypothetical protein